MTIVVIDDRIDRVIAGYAQPDNLGLDEDTTVIDLKDQWVTPGLIDCHTHLTGQLKPAIERMRSRMQEGEAHSAIDAVANARKTLMAGFTTVRNVGSGGSVGLALRDRINQGVVPGPRMFVSGPPVSVTGGHGDPTNALSPALRP
ncbi:MAG TPA: amidohydrolase, partial [Phycisphaerales bacterium]|nr:amidohydrolase [Phycisphaerales bacterium]